MKWKVFNKNFKIKEQLLDQPRKFLKNKIMNNLKNLIIYLKNTKTSS